MKYFTAVLLVLLLAVGGYWNLEGKTLEEIQPKSFQEWRADWMDKYAE
ncbi:hypothetical protein J7E73_26525 [Paenibacillus albidus]|nr:hypothetical protein [Paenibacillus albidus]MBT2292627.1 hypothetical protein [Paenibacillus albidus]